MKNKEFLKWLEFRPIKGYYLVALYIGLQDISDIQITSIKKMK